MGTYEQKMEENLEALKVHSEVYFGQDSYVGNSMHKIYYNFLNGESKLIDGFKESHTDLYKQLLDLWIILSKNHKYFAKFAKLSLQRSIQFISKMQALHEKCTYLDFLFEN